PRNLRPTDFGPRTNIQRRVDISVGGMTTVLAGEDGLAASIGRCNMSANMTLLARMLGVHQDHRDTRQARLVLDKAAELCKGPARHTSPLRLPERSPLADAVEVFEGNPTPT